MRNFSRKFRHADSRKTDEILRRMKDGYNVKFKSIKTRAKNAVVSEIYYI